MGRGRKRIRRGTNIAERAVLMGESAEARPEVLGKNRWEREFRLRGLPRWQYHMEIITPYVDYLKVSPKLTAEQRQVAVKEYLRRYREGFPLFNQVITREAEDFASAITIPIVERSPKPAMGFSPELIV